MNTRLTTARIGPWTVRIVFKGERYGRDGGPLRHEQDEPLVEFYDAEQDSTKFGPLGQFVNRYNITTLLSRKHLGMPLCLHGGYPNDWTVSGEHMALIERWLELQSIYNEGV